MTEAETFLRPRPALAPGVEAIATTRAQGNLAPYVGQQVGDDRVAVANNRRLLRRSAALPSEPVWLEQVHGARVLDLDLESGVPQAPQADAAITGVPGRVLAVLSADCLPVVLAATDGSAVAVAHCGWRGLAAGVLDAAVDAMSSRSERFGAWLGPAIGVAAYEVGEEVAARFAHIPGAVDRDRGPRPHLDLYAVARSRLQAVGVDRVQGGEHCTFEERDRFFSHRRGGDPGRQATLVWLDG